MSTDINFQIATGVWRYTQQEEALLKSKLSKDNLKKLADIAAKAKAITPEPARYELPKLPRGPSQTVRELIGAKDDKALEGREYEKLVLDLYDAMHGPRKPRLVSKTVPPKLKKGLKPGSVVIILKGIYTGRRAVFLKQCKSGELLLTGPSTVNKVPLTRISQKYVIVTSTTIPMDGVNVSSIDDTYFKVSGRKRSREVFLQEQKDQAQPVDPAKEKTQSEVDAAVLKNVEKVELMKDYLRHRFIVSKSMAPHRMKF
eukprot:TRINITY_DN12539_c0_g1_i1.p1 TRINITY_DN12539_c0_g1~~TRINITY_DN12539_c0_g1_i1.p1  ORF type:complete len:257 (-),score=30.40 TRINITY_DN12539_c0_g1_i1:48-818(-)